MTETKLTDLLEHTANQTPVGPPPLHALYAGAAHRRRRRTAGFVAATAVAVGAVIGASTLLPSGSSTAPVTSPTPVPVGPATRLVGIGHAAIAVPADWPTNKGRCGTPWVDTVLIDDPSALSECMSYRRAGVESVQLTGSPTLDFHADETFTIDGVRAERQRTTCMAASTGVEVCSGAVGVPTLGVWFRAESSTSAAEVDRILARIAIVPDRTGVPSHLSLRRPDTVLMGAEYGHVLEQVGLKPAFRTMRSPNYPAGMVLDVSPAAGTMLKPGATVTVTVAG
jgi:hypothetical protein